MAKAKRQQQKSKKQNNPKRGKDQEKRDLGKFREQLDALGLKVVQVTSDGNCFFRSLADQLEGDEEQHMKYRSMVVAYIMKNRGEFEPFIEDDISFDDYCKSMEEDGTWAGHMELQAASLVTQCNICIHRIMSPRWYIQNFDSDRTPMVHLSYHDGEHYNSLRLKYDDGDGPARVVIIKADANLSSTSSRQKNSKSRANPQGKSVDGAVKRVMSVTSCHDTKKVEEVLQEFNGDIDAAIQFIMAERAFDECPTNDDNCQKNDFDSYELDDCGNEKQKGPQSDCSISSEVDKCDTILNENGKGKPIEKIIPRNKVCPCGSKKKYKACCGSDAGNSANVVMSRIVSEQAQWKREKIDNSRSGDSKKGKKHGRRMETADTPSRNGQIDMGALCI